VTLAAALGISPAAYAAAGEQPKESLSVDAQGSPVPADKALQTMMNNVDEAFKAVGGVWPGYRPTEHPIVLAWKDDKGQVMAAITINHRNAAGLGDATQIDTTGTTLGTVHRVENLKPDVAKELQELKTFNFAKEIGGVDSFLMNAGGSDDFFDPTKKDYAVLLIHELFHRYQIQEFPEEGPGQLGQDYDYSARNIELATLENRALVAALNAKNETDRDEAARRFSGIRLSRLAADSRVRIDDYQESIEGTARYLEHRIGGEDKDYRYNSDNYDQDIPLNVGLTEVKEYYGFARWYASGAAILRLNELMRVDNFTTRVENGETPAAILADELGVTASDADKLVIEARQAYDPDNELPGKAKKAAKKAAQEGPIFDPPPTD